MDLDVAHVQNRTQHLEDLVALVLLDANLLQRADGVLEAVRGLVPNRHLRALLRVAEPLGGHQAQLRCHLWVQPALGRRDLVEDVKVALPILLPDDARLLQEVRVDLGAAQGVLLVKVDVDVLAESRRVVISQRLGVAKRLEDWVALQHPSLRVGRHGRVVRDGGEVLHHELCALRLAGPRVARDQDGLVLALRLQVGEGALGDTKHVRGHLVRLLPAVVHQRLLAVELEVAPGVHAHEDGPRRRVNLVLHVPHAKRMQHVGLVQVGQRRQVVHRLHVGGRPLRNAIAAARQCHLLPIFQTDHKVPVCHTLHSAW
mmetsp:Transcript_20920/g.50792  ORF Transcript_20920/g.50792 Transcript_20920/m.50792 type:complete len:315 (+) Transcript_20920:1479-2423(+)